jgi:amino acid permease
MTLPTLTAMVVGSMIGTGVFSLPARFGTATGVVGALVAWVIAPFELALCILIIIGAVIGVVALVIGAVTI